jgi:hypothetical protein
MARSRSTTLMCALLLVLGLAGLPVASSAGAPPECRWAARGYDVNQWVGGAGTWGDATRWSKGRPPGVGNRDYACIPQGSVVVVDATTPRVDLNLLELGRGARLTLTPGTSLFVWGDQDDVRSILKRDSVVEVDGATLGGGGRLHVIGTIDAHWSASGAPAVLTTMPPGSTYSGKPGILEIGDDGTLDLRGARAIRLATQYIVDVHGRIRTLEDSGILADFGTTMLLQPHYRGHGVGKLIVLNDGDFLAGAQAGVDRPPTFVNRGRIAKRGTGLTRIEGRYFGRGKVSGDAGGNGAMLIPPVTAEATASSGERTTEAVPQVASITLPAISGDDTTTTIEPLTEVDVPGAVGHPMKVHATALLASVADPAVIALRYDASLFGGSGEPSADPAALTVRHADGAGADYTEVPACLGRSADIPLGAFACVDLASSRVDDAGGGDRVVPTPTTSRWIVD